MELLSRSPIAPSGSLAPMNHCATLAELPDGTLLAAWFTGAFETAPDQHIVLARLPAGAQSWTAPQIAVDTPHQADGQPVFHQPRPGTLWLYYVTLHGPDWTHARMMRRLSADEGRRWGPPEALPFPAGFMFRSRPFSVGGGRWLFPGYDERAWRSVILFSGDHGRHWGLGPTLETPVGNIHPCLIRGKDGGLMAYLRPGGTGGVLWRAHSQDQGRSWSTPEPTTLPNPNSGFDLIRLHDGRLLLANNPDPRRRTPLTLAVSQDEGTSWETVVVLEEGDAEYSYPWLLQQRTGTVHCVYTWRRRCIVHAVLHP